jgi:GNAT superfamily N-acetyltransferase
MADPFTPPPFETWLRHVRDNPSTIPEGYFIALDGERYVGMSSLERRETGEDLETGFTCVLREYRGKGIAMALKLLAIGYARQRGVPFIRTENDSTNRPMLRINEALGFARQPAWILLAKQLRAE